MKSFALATLAALLFSTVLLAQGTGIPKPIDGGPHKGLHNVAMTVSDIDASVAFYSKAVPFEVVKRYRVKGSAFPAELLSKRHKQVEIALVRLPTGFIQLMDFEPSAAAPPNPRPVIGPGYSHICFQSSSADPAIKRFMAAGLSVISRFGKPDGVDIGGYGVRYAYGRDPDGIMIENESLDAPARSEAAWITHFAASVHDRDAMLAFYEKLLGRKAHRTVEQENRPRLDDVAGIDNLKIRGGWVTVGNMDIELWQYVRPQTPAPMGRRKLDEIGYNSFALEVRSLSAEQRRLKDLDVTLVGKPANIGGWRVQYGYDPEGNIFAVQQNISADRAASLQTLLQKPH